VGKKVAVTLDLDTSSPHDKAVYDALVALPNNEARRDYMVSAMLYYVRSPSYLMALKLDESYAQVKALSELIKSPKLDSLADKLSGVSEALTVDLKAYLESIVAAAVGKAFQSQRFTPAPAAAEESCGHEDADELIGQMMSEFLT
jgi:hypothetical protein